MDTRDLRSLCEPYGGLVSVVIHRPANVPQSRQRNFGFVTFNHSFEADACVLYLSTSTPLFSALWWQNHCDSIRLVWVLPLTACIFASLSLLVGIRRVSVHFNPEMPPPQMVFKALVVQTQFCWLRCPYPCLLPGCLALNLWCTFAGPSMHWMALTTRSWALWSSPSRTR